MKTYITGLSGTGKTTIAKELENRGYKVISIDEHPNLCCWINKITKEKVDYNADLNLDFVQTHDWVCDISMLKELLNSYSSEDDIFVTGITANQNEFIDMFDKIIFLKCPPDVLIDRLNNRTNNDFGKNKEIQDMILSSHSDFENNLIQKGAKVIDVDRDLEEVIGDILA